MKHPADPTPQSAQQVLDDSAYKVLVSEPQRQTGQVTTVLVVIHAASKTCWATTYPPTMPTLALAWQQVDRTVETRIVYRPVSS